MSARGWIAVAGIGALALGLFLLAAHGALTPLGRAATRYVQALHAETRALHLETTGLRIALAQLAATVGLVIGATVLEVPLLLALIAPVAVAPRMALTRARDLRTLAIEQQLDVWLTLMANALRASPSLGEAIASTAALAPSPTSQELDMTVKEMRLGMAVNEALYRMTERVKSRVVTTAVRTVLVARETGGDLSSILERSAASLREMQRLEGVLRTKTADARMQSMVLAIVPWLLVGALHQVDSTWLEPLWTSWQGYAVVAVATALWLASLIAARRILAVDL